VNQRQFGPVRDQNAVVGAAAIPQRGR